MCSSDLTELCGGTHLKNTKYVEQFKITQETAVSSGVRRIEAVAGELNLQDLHSKIIDALNKKIEKFKNANKDSVKDLNEKLQKNFIKFSEKLAIKNISVVKADKTPRWIDYNQLDTVIQEVEKGIVETEKQIKKEQSKAKNKQAGEQSSNLKDKIQSIPNTDCFKIGRAHV